MLRYYNQFASRSRSVLRLRRKKNPAGVRGFLLYSLFLRSHHAEASHSEVDVVRDPFPELILTFRRHPDAILLAPRVHDFVVHGPHADTTPRNSLLPVHSDRRAWVERAHGDPLGGVLEATQVDLRGLARAITV